MAAVLLIIHLMIAAVLVGVVLLQKSQGGALGISGGGWFLAGRGTANLLTRTTASLAAAFFTSSILLTLLANHSAHRGSVFDNFPAATAPENGSTQVSGSGTKPEPVRGSILDKLETLRAPLVPQNQ